MNFRAFRLRVVTLFYEMVLLNVRIQLYKKNNTGRKWFLVCVTRRTWFIWSVCALFDFGMSIMCGVFYFAKARICQTTIELFEIYFIAILLQQNGTVASHCNQLDKPEIFTAEVQILSNVQILTTRIAYFSSCCSASKLCPKPQKIPRYNDKAVIPIRLHPRIKFDKIL